MNTFSLFKRGFTIVEVVFVLAIIGILLTAIVVSTTTYRNRADKSSAVAVAEQVKLKLSTYFQKRNRYPATQTDVVSYLNSDLGTKFSNTTVYTYTATTSDGNTCTLNDPATPCDKYTITVSKTAWRGTSSDNNVTITP